MEGSLNPFRKLLVAPIIYATTANTGITLLDGYYCSSQGFQLDKTDVGFSHLATYKAPSSIPSTNRNTHRPVQPNVPFLQQRNSFWWLIQRGSRSVKVLRKSDYGMLSPTWDIYTVIPQLPRLRKQKKDCKSQRSGKIARK